eukprot:CAMPEP_0174738576 /NCGR_PEP_ID=MMETSP1094-20130205/70194_1 /TAXON_ID=156173 /ORGANISM="Chrysochromulina brevifilum, Strain UTEX LB 985" /LENGTH=122 /DNA_ID=CAMNT_0015942015 /DNA_START=116 /DNA_END=484 /DNA_ORIENTATION=+
MLEWPSPWHDLPNRSAHATDTWHGSRMGLDARGSEHGVLERISSHKVICGTAKDLREFGMRHRAPASTGNVWPVMNRASSPSKKAVAAATSLGCTSPGSAFFAVTCAVACGWVHMPRVRSSQ